MYTRYLYFRIRVVFICSEHCHSGQTVYISVQSGTFQPSADHAGRVSCQLGPRLSKKKKKLQGSIESNRCSTPYVLDSLLLWHTVQYPLHTFILVARLENLNALHGAGFFWRCGAVRSDFTAPHRAPPHHTAPHRTTPHRTAPHRTAPFQSKKTRIRDETHRSTLISEKILFWGARFYTTVILNEGRLCPTLISV